MRLTFQSMGRALVQAIPMIIGTLPAGYYYVISYYNRWVWSRILKSILLCGRTQHPSPPLMHAGKFQLPRGIWRRFVGTTGPLNILQ